MNTTKKVMLSGGTAGIGRAIALKLAEEGYHVYLFGRSAAKIDDVRKDAQERGIAERLTMEAFDMNDTSAFESTILKWLEEEGPFEVLVNNAAIGYGDVEGDSLASLDYMMKANLTSYLWLAGLLTKHMKQHGLEGEIVQIGSMSAHGREAGSSGYVASKSGIQGFSEALRKELREEKIRVTYIEPGMVGSDMHDMSLEEEKKDQKELKLLKAEDIADVVWYALQAPKRVNLVEVKVKPLCQEE